MTMADNQAYLDSIREENLSPYESIFAPRVEAASPVSALVQLTQPYAPTQSDYEPDLGAQFTPQNPAEERGVFVPQRPFNAEDRLSQLHSSIDESNGLPTAPSFRRAPEPGIIDAIAAAAMGFGAGYQGKPSPVSGYLKERQRPYDEENELAQKDYENRLRLAVEGRLQSGEKRANAEEQRHQSRFEREESVGKELQSIFDAPPKVDEPFTDPTTGEQSTRSVIDVQRRNQLMASAMSKLRTAAGNAAAIRMLQDEPLNAEQIHNLFNLPMPQAREIAKRGSFDDQTKLYAQIDAKRRADLAAQREARVEARGEADLQIKERTRAEVERHNRAVESRQGSQGGRAPTRTELLLRAADGDPQALKAFEIETGLRGDPLKKKLAEMIGSSGGQSSAPLQAGAPAQHPVRVAPPAESSGVVRQKSKSGKPMISRDGGKTWQYE